MSNNPVDSGSNLGNAADGSNQLPNRVNNQPSFRDMRWC